MTVAMQDQLPERRIENASLEVQLMNLGRILENPSVINDFSHNDFSCHEVKMLIFRLKSNAVLEAKNLYLKQFMERRGLRNWGESSSMCLKELFDTQRRQATLHKLSNEMSTLRRYVDTAAYSVTPADALRSLRRASKLFEACLWAIDDDGSVPEEDEETINEAT